MEGADEAGPETRGGVPPAAYASGVQIAVLGPIEVRRHGEPVDLGAPKRRLLLSALALSAGRPVAVDTLIDLLWGDAPTQGAMTSLQAYVSGLRKALEPDRERRGSGQVLVTEPPGYALRVPREAVDAVRFVDVVTEQHRRLALPLLGPAPLDREALLGAVRSIDEALGWWRGEPYADLGDAPSAAAERSHLEELRLMALEDRAGARLALGEHATTAAELEALTTTHPLRERLWALRALALVRCGRQADALEVLRTVRAVLADELGLDPGVDLQDLQQRVLRQDPELAWVPPSDRAQSTPSAQRPVTPAPGTAAEPAVPGQVWPMLGRDRERSRVLARLDEAIEGRAGFVAVTGDPGIGKTRLCAETLSEARRRGARTAVGRCSQDDGAPPLYPWLSVLNDLGAPLPELVGDEGGDFRTWEEISAGIRQACQEHPVVVVLDDLHWADTATLRVLRLLVESVSGERLLVLATWRSRPAPEGALGDLAETLARHHAERVELTGLDGTAVAGIVDAVTEHRPTDEQAAALRDRTDGNPFFLVEYSRLVGRGDDLAALLGEAHPPTAVQEVVGRRLERLPGETRRVLRTAAVIGRRFDVPVLAQALDLDEDELLDLLDTAQAVGLVHEDGVDRFAFDHALVRDTLNSSTSTSRRARQHARVAEVLAQHPGRETETAMHWLAAGPSHAAQAWRAAAAAGEVALRSHAHEEAADLYGQALAALELDPTADDRDRYALHEGLTLCHRWAGRWPEVTTAARDAIDVATRLDDAALLARAATLTLRGALWQSARHGGVNEAIVSALRRSLELLSPGDSALRCRCLIGLAGELYYASGLEERQALTAEAVAMAQRLGEPDLLVDTYLGAVNAIWAPGSETVRLEHARAALDLAVGTGDAHAEVTARTQISIAAGELGRPDLMWEEYRAARPLAGRLRMSYAIVVLDSMVVAWLAMAGELERCDEIFASLLDELARTHLPQAEDAIGGVVAAICLWRGSPLPEEVVTGLAASPLPTNASLAYMLWRSGDEDRARAWLRDHPAELEHQDWYSRLDWSFAAAMAAYLGDAELGARTYRLLAPYAGQSAVAGSGVASGPVDAYLAMAALATGETELARRHADDAEQIAEGWQIPLFTQWLREQRDRLGF